MKKLICGVGINDANYFVCEKGTIGYIDGKQKQKLVWICPFYRVWKGMIERGYSDKYKLKYPTYRDVTVSEEWHRFTTFKKWMEKQDYEGKQLDKDLLVTGNKIYSPEACVFVSRQVNMFLIDSAATRGKYKVGCCWNKHASKFIAHCRNPFTCEQEYLGYFMNEEEAHEAWLDKKLEHAYALAATQTEERVAKAIIDKYENYKSS